MTLIVVGFVLIATYFLSPAIGNKYSAGVFRHPMRHQCLAEIRAIERRCKYNGIWTS